MRDIYDSGFDEDDGRTIQGTCPDCEGRLRTDSGETTGTICKVVKSPPIYIPLHKIR